MSQQKKKMSLSDLGGLVYSTGALPEAGNEELTPVDPRDQNLRVWLEKNHRGGKTVTVVKGFEGSDEELNDLSKLLKNKCGTGGSAKEGEIIIQGDHRDKVVQILIEKGFPTKKAGA
jgi:translation initiation factor 1